MYQRALARFEKAGGPNHTSTLNIVNNLGTLHAAQDKHVEVVKMYRQALDRKKKARDPDRTSTLETNNC